MKKMASCHLNLSEWKPTVIILNFVVLKRICYFPSWSQRRTGDGNYTTANVDANLCTHIIYAFPSMNESTFQVENHESNDPRKFGCSRNVVTAQYCE